MAPTLCININRTPYFSFLSQINLPFGIKLQAHMTVHILLTLPPLPHISPPYLPPTSTHLPPSLLFSIRPSLLLYLLSHFLSLSISVSPSFSIIPSLSLSQIRDLVVWFIRAGGLAAALRLAGVSGSSSGGGGGAEGNEAVLVFLPGTREIQVYIYICIYIYIMCSAD